MLQSLQLKDFRCFSDVTFELGNSLVLIEGLNGAGKTSFLEALHYACYVRSFRAFTPRDMIRFGAQSFFVKVVTENDTLVCGFTQGKRIARLNQQKITSHEEIKPFFTVVTITEDDLELVKNEPEKRRAFLDHVVCLLDPSLHVLYKQYKIVLDHRNALLHTAYDSSFSEEELVVWTEKAWLLSKKIEGERKKILHSIQQQIDTLLQKTLSLSHTIILSYQSKQHEHAIHTINDWDTFKLVWKKQFYADEIRFKRTLFGIHLDDILIHFCDKPARFYSSRGQQKLIVVLIKIALLTLLIEQGISLSAITLMLDDFMTDFDHTIARKCIELCTNMGVQCIISSPAVDAKSFDTQLLINKGALRISLSN